MGARLRINARSEAMGPRLRMNDAGREVPVSAGARR
jgi:hypothetical protein